MTAHLATDHGNDIAVLVAHLVGRGIIVIPAQRAGTRRRALHRLGDVTVLMLLLEPTIVADSRERQRRRRFHRPVGRNHRHLVFGRLRRGERTAPAEIQELHGRCRRHTDEVVGAGEVEVELVAVALHAEVGIHAADLRLREIPPTVVFDIFAGDEATPIAATRTRGDLALDVPERAVAPVHLDALKIETVAHQIVAAPPIALRPKTGLAPTIVMPSIALSGRKSQLTMSPKLSLMRTPF